MAKSMTREQLVEIYMAYGMNREAAAQQLPYHESQAYMAAPKELAAKLAELDAMDG